MSLGDDSGMVLVSVPIDVDSALFDVVTEVTVTVETIGTVVGVGIVAVASVMDVVIVDVECLGFSGARTSAASGV
jgi:hypothetical protein